MLVGLDLDGVLYRWTDAALDTLRDLRGRVIPDYGPDQKWNHIREFISDDDWHWLWNARKARRQMFGTGRGFADGVRAARELQKIGDVVIVTKRPPDTMAATMTWLAAHELNPHAVVLGPGDKHTHPFAPCYDVFVDDKVENAVGMAGIGCPTFVPARPYNLEAEGHDGVVRFDDWNVVIEHVMDHG